MADIHIYVDIRLSPRIRKWISAGLLLCLCAPELGSENVTLTTYYPAPSGVYAKMMTTADAYFATASGRVGIGTTNPAYKLTVVGAGDSIVGLSGAAGSSASIGVGTTATQARLGIVAVAGDYAGNSAAGDAVLRVDSSSKRLHLLAGTGNAVLTLTNAQASIGSTNPSATTNVQLEVGDGSSVGAIRARQTGCALVDVVNGTNTRCMDVGYPNHYATAQTGIWSEYASGAGATKFLCCPCGASGCPASP